MTKKDFVLNKIESQIVTNRQTILEQIEFAERAIQRARQAAGRGGFSAAANELLNIAQNSNEVARAHGELSSLEPVRAALTGNRHIKKHNPFA